MVEGVQVSSRPANGDTYWLDETIRIEVEFSEAVQVSGTPTIEIDMDPAYWGLKTAEYEGGSGTNTLTFAHVVVEPNYSTPGIAVVANSLRGTITRPDSATTATLTHPGLNHDAAHKVNWQLPAPVAVPEPVAAALDAGAPTSAPEPVPEPTAIASAPVTPTPASTPLPPTSETIPPPEPPELPTDYSHMGDCPVTLTGFPSGDYEVRIEWTTPDGCQTGGIRVQHKKSGFLAWDSSHLAFVGRDDSVKASIFGSLDPVEYEFRVVVVDGHGVEHTSNEFSVLVREDVTKAPDVGRPTNVHASPNMFRGIIVSWSPPSRLPDGMTNNGYYVEYQQKGSSTWVSAGDRIAAGCNPCSLDGYYLPAIPAVPDDPNTQDVDESAAEVPAEVHGVAGAVEGTEYQVRVATELKNAADETVRAYAPMTDYVAIHEEPLQVWWADDTPNYNSNLNRVFMTVSSNYSANTSATCYINGGAINCPPNTLVSLEVYPGGKYNIRATGTSRGRTGTLPAVDISIPNDGTSASRLSGSLLPQEVYGSGGRIRSANTEINILTIYYTPVAAAKSKFETYYLFVKNESDSTYQSIDIGQDDPDVDRFITHSSVTNNLSGRIHYYLRAYVGIQEITKTETVGGVETEVTENVSLWGPSTPVQSAVVGSAALPGNVTGGTVSHDGPGVLWVEWDIPEAGDENILGYRVGYRKFDDTFGITEEMTYVYHYPRKSWRDCRYLAVHCANPRRVKLSGLESGVRYTITVQAINANGPGSATTMAWGAAPN